MKLNKYIERDGQKLRLGYTTGSCAAAAARAAAEMLLTGRRVSQVRLRTPKGVNLILDIEDIRFWEEQKESSGAVAPEASPGAVSESVLKTIPQAVPDRRLTAVSCAVRKDSGDDPDITDHALIYAKVARSAAPGIRIYGGEGVGRVTRPGMDQPVGSAAINSTPRRMIRETVLDALPRRDPEGFDITIFVPQGRELAAKTFNPRLGIEGGISILGTSGIVEPMSNQALLDTIRVEIRIRKEEGLAILPVVPGNYGRKFLLEEYGFPLDTLVTSSNFIYDTVKMAADAGFTRMLFAGHIGKLIKIAGGIRNTHSRYGDHRMDILMEIAKSILYKNEDAFERLRCALADCVMMDEAIRILRESGLEAALLPAVTRRIQKVMQDWAHGRMQVEVVVFSGVYGELGRTEKALEYMRILQEQLSAT